jgi:dipeptidyl aminopeptidase/acylaminoacyl peptidase
VFPDDFVSITTASADKMIMVVNVSNTNNPGDYYLVNLKEGSVKPLFSISPWLDRNKLVKAMPVKYTARDGLEIPALLTLTKQETDKIISLSCLMEVLILNKEFIMILGRSF